MVKKNRIFFLKRAFIQKKRHFLKRILFRKKLHTFSKGKSALKSIRIFQSAIRGFLENSGFLQASNLTFYTLLSLVPILAIFLGLADFFGGKKLLQTALIEEFSHQKELGDWLFIFAERLLEETKKGPFKALGAAFFLWSAFSVLQQIESSMNQIWKIRAKRSFSKKCFDSAVFFLVVPCFFLLANRLRIFLFTKAPDRFYLREILGLIVPFFSMWVVFSFSYFTIPYKKYPAISASISGAIMAFFYESIQWAYFSLQMGASSYSAIYGSFAAMPLFLTWVYMSWMVFLFGSELNYALWIYTHSKNGYLAKNPSQKMEKILALYLIKKALKNGFFEEHPCRKKALFAGMDFQPFLESVLQKLVSLKIFSVF